MAEATVSDQQEREKLEVRAADAERHAAKLAELEGEMEEVRGKERLASLHRMLGVWDGYISIALLVDDYATAVPQARDGATPFPRGIERHAGGGGCPASRAPPDCASSPPWCPRRPNPKP